MEDHIITRHLDLRPYKCPECDTWFGRLQNGVDSHLEKFHGHPKPEAKAMSKTVVPVFPSDHSPREPIRVSAASITSNTATNNAGELEHTAQEEEEEEEQEDDQDARESDGLQSRGSSSNNQDQVSSHHNGPYISSGWTTVNQPYKSSSSHPPPPPPPSRGNNVLSRNNTFKCPIEDCGFTARYRRLIQDHLKSHHHMTSEQAEAIFPILAENAGNLINNAGGDVMFEVESQQDGETAETVQGDNAEHQDPMEIDNEDDLDVTFDAWAATGPGIFAGVPMVAGSSSSASGPSAAVPPIPSNYQGITMTTSVTSDSAPLPTSNRALSQLTGQEIEEEAHLREANVGQGPSQKNSKGRTPLPGRRPREDEQ